MLHKTLDILEAIKKQERGVALADLARVVSLPKPTVYRILATLEYRGYLDRRGDGAYRMAEKLFKLQRDSSESQSLLRVAQPIMGELASECRETVNLATIDGGEVVVIATVESPQSIRMSSKVGNRRCIHTTAIGKALLAEMNDKAILRLVQIKGLPRLTANSLCTRSALAAELRRVREQGYAVDRQENEMDGRCIGMAIPRLNGDSAAALSISGPVFRMELKRLRSFRPMLRAACDQISKALGV